MFCGLTKIEFIFLTSLYATDLNVPVMKILLLVNIDEIRMADNIALTIFRDIND